MMGAHEKSVSNLHIELDGSQSSKGIATMSNGYIPNYPLQYSGHKPAVGIWRIWRGGPQIF